MSRLGTDDPLADDLEIIGAAGALHLAMVRAAIAVREAELSTQRPKEANMTDETAPDVQDASDPTQLTAAQSVRLTCLHLAQDYADAAMVAAGYAEFVLRGTTFAFDDDPSIVAPASASEDYGSAELPRPTAPGAEVAKGWGEQLGAKLASSLVQAIDLTDGNIEFQRSDGVATIKIQRYVRGEDAKALEALLRQFFADLQERQVGQAMQAREKTALEQVDYLRGSPLAGDDKAYRASVVGS